MAKKKQATKPDADGVLRTGIYERHVGPPLPYDSEALQCDQQRCDASSERSLSEQLDVIRLSLRPIIEPFVEQVNQQPELWTQPGKYGVLDIGDGPFRYRQLPSIESGTPEAEQARDALDALHEIDEIGHCISRDETSLFQCAVRLGSLLEQISIRPFESLVISSKKHRTGGSKGAVIANKGRAEIYASVAIKYQGDVDRLMRGGLSYNKATEQVAKQYNVCAKTVQRHTKNPSPANRGRKR